MNELDKECKATNKIKFKKMSIKRKQFKRTM